jgi:hypothetical protein
LYVPPGVAVSVAPLLVTLALYADPATSVWPALNVSVMVQVLMVYEELLVTVTVAPKSGGLFDGVCQPTLYAAAHAAPVSAGALVAPNVTATVAAAATATASAALPRRLDRIRMAGSFN